MKQFKKKHNKLPKEEVVFRMMRMKWNPLTKERLSVKYFRELDTRTTDILPRAIRAVTLARLSRTKALHMEYYSDMHNFILRDSPNRCLPIEKFLGLFKGYWPQDELDKLTEELTHYRLEFYTAPEDWIETYSHKSVSSCMTGASTVGLYCHPENNLGLAVLYPPGGHEPCARTIVNLKEKWYVRLFGDAILVDKLKTLGYYKLSYAPHEFKMYAHIPGSPSLEMPNLAEYLEAHRVLPYLDFIYINSRILPETYDPDRSVCDIIINAGITEGNHP